MASDIPVKTVRIPVGSMMLEGLLGIPKKSKGLVIFAHGSANSKHSPRNNYVAKELRKHNIATLLFDLLTEEEDFVPENKFNIDLLTERLIAATNWALSSSDTKKLKLAYFGSCTGTAAALVAAAEHRSRVYAIVSRSGRPDMVMSVLGMVKAPTLFLVGENDDVVIDLNKQAYYNMAAEKEMVIIPGASHLFEEPGVLDDVSKLTVKWFTKYLKNK
jgi:dienelactone hydrolase